MSKNSSAVREIKSRLSILEIVRRYVELRQAGNRWVAPCPFHQETKPSFSVNEEEGFFYCFGCQAAGDIFDFYSRINGLEFRETLEQLAEEAGVSLGDFKPNTQAVKERDNKRVALKMYALASKYFQGNFFSDNGEDCRKYIKNRKLSKETVELFELGWSKPEWQGLTDSLRRAGFSPQQGIDVGLLAPSDRGGAYDRFRGRLIFPIKSLSGQTIAFGGRIIADEDAAKYINSTDSPIYKKGDNLYGLFQARRAISVARSAFLTEGYMDVLTLHQFGYTNACGVLGTALTEEQVRRLAGFCSDFELIFDGDKPGRKAALRSAEMFLRKGLRCRVVLLPETEDIDSLLQNKGKEAFEELREFAPDGLDFCIRTLSSQFAPKDILEWVKEFIANVEQPELLTRYVSRLTQAFELDELEIRRFVSNRMPQAAGAVSPSSPTGGSASNKNTALDKELMKFLVRYPHHLPKLRDAGALLLLTQNWAISFWDKIASCAPEYEMNEVLHVLDDKEKEFWGHYRVMEAPPKEHEMEELNQICSVIIKKCREKQNAAYVHALRQGSASGDDIDIELLKAANEALALRRSLGSTNG